MQGDKDTVKKVHRLEKRRKCRVKNAECRVDSLSVSPLPKPEFAKGSEKGTIREAIVGVRLGESPGSTQGCFSLREKSAVSG